MDLLRKVFLAAAVSLVSSGAFSEVVGSYSNGCIIDPAVLPLEGRNYQVTRPLSALSRRSPLRRRGRASDRYR